MRFKALLISLCLLLIVSCTTTTPIEKPYVDSGYSLLDSSDPNSNNEYLARMERYDSILHDSPVPLYVISSEEFAAEIFLKMSRKNILGLYFYGRQTDKYPQEFIFINSSLTPEQIMVTYFHEIAHYRHRINKCQGCFESPVTRESHALYNELKMGWEHDMPMVIESSVRMMALYAISDKSNITYKMATFEIMKTDLWRQTIEYLKTVEK